MRRGVGSGLSRMISRDIVIVLRFTRVGAHAHIVAGVSRVGFLFTNQRLIDVTTAVATAVRISIQFTIHIPFAAAAAAAFRLGRVAAAMMLVVLARGASRRI